MGHNLSSHYVKRQSPDLNPGCLALAPCPNSYLIPPSGGKEEAQHRGNLQTQEEGAAKFWGRTRPQVGGLAPSLLPQGTPSPSLLLPRIQPHL